MSNRHGIFFGLPHQDYLADPALGSSAIKALVHEPARYWFESPHLNPAAKLDEDAKHFRVGRAFHALALEGRAEFERRFCMAPGADYLRTVDQIAEVIRAKGGKVAKRKAEVIEEALRLDPALKIYDVAIQAAKDAGLEILSEEEFTNVVRAAQSITGNPHLAPALKGGQAEVSIFWEEEVDGVSIRCKARFDYLKPRAVVDLKSGRSIGSRPFEAECRSAIASYRYDLQAEHYLTARERFAEFWEADDAYFIHRAGDGEDIARIVAGFQDDTVLQLGDAVSASDESAFVFVFWANEGAPLTWGGSLSRGNPILELAARDRERALANYARCVKAFAPGEPWLDYSPLVELDIGEMPIWFGR